MLLFFSKRACQLTKKKKKFMFKPTSGMNCTQKAKMLNWTSMMEKIESGKKFIKNFKDFVKKLHMR